MWSYYFKSRKNTERKNLKVPRRKNGRIILLSKCEFSQNLQIVLVDHSQKKKQKKNKERIQKFYQTRDPW